jgi:hypothetical protein
MNNVEILPLIIDLTGSFFRSSRDALERARQAQLNKSPQEPAGLNIFPYRAEGQASIESIVFSFLTIEATINYLFFNELRERQLKGIEKWLRQKWKWNLSIYDRFILLLNQFSMADVDNFQYLTSLFTEFITFRNRIVHAMPEQYHALVERSGTESEVLLHDVEPVQERRHFSISDLSDEIGRINYEDAKRCFEIMLLVICFLDEQFIAEFEFPWPAGVSVQKYLRPRDIIASLDFRYYTKLCIESFIPESIKELKKVQQNNQPDRE